MPYNSSLIELFYLREFQTQGEPFTMDYTNPSLRPEKHETDIDMAPNQPDFLMLDVTDCLLAMQTFTRGLKHFKAEPRLSLQYVMDVIHQSSMMEFKIQAMLIDVLQDAHESDVETVAEANLLCKGLEMLARRLYAKLNMFGVYGNGDYLTYQFYDLNQGKLSLNKITIADPNEYFPSSTPILPAWITERAQNQNQQHFPAAANYF